MNVRVCSRSTLTILSLLPPSLPQSKLTREGGQGDGHAGGGGAGSSLGGGAQRVAHHKGVAGHGKGGGPQDGAVGLHDDGRSAVWCGGVVGGQLQALLAR